MTSANLNRYIKEYLKRQPKTLSMSQIEELIEYDAWLDTQSGLTQRAADLAVCTCEDVGNYMMKTDPACPVHGNSPSR